MHLFCLANLGVKEEEDDDVEEGKNNKDEESNVRNESDTEETDCSEMSEDKVEQHQPNTRENNKDEQKSETNNQEKTNSSNSKESVRSSNQKSKVCSLMFSECGLI